jgi:hypothetical protein
LMKYINNVDTNNLVSEKKEINNNKMIFSGMYKTIDFLWLSLERMVMNKNTYLGLALTACLSIASAPLLAEVVPAPKHPANITAPGTSATEPLEPSELQRQQGEDDKANITAPGTSAPEPLEPSEIQRQQGEGDKANITEPGTSVTEPLEPSELQRQQGEHDKAIAK